MTKNVYVGNLSYDTTQVKLRELFEAHGQVAMVDMITDHYTGRHRGFAFVEMMTEKGAIAVINALNGHQVDGRAINVTQAKPREPRGASRGQQNNRRW